MAVRPRCRRPRADPPIWWRKVSRSSSVSSCPRSCGTSRPKVVTELWQDLARSRYSMVCSIVRTAVPCSRIRSRGSAELSNWARLTSVPVVPPRITFQVTSGGRCRRVVASSVTVSPLVGSVTTPHLPDGGGMQDARPAGCCKTPSGEQVIGGQLRHRAQVGSVASGRLRMKPLRGPARLVRFAGEGSPRDRGRPLARADGAGSTYSRHMR